MQLKVNELMRTRSLQEVWASPAAQAPERHTGEAGDTAVAGRGRSRTRTGRDRRSGSRAASRGGGRGAARAGSRTARRGGQRAGAREARGRGGQGRRGWLWAGATREGLQQEEKGEGATKPGEADGQLPMASASGSGKRHRPIRVAAWNCFQKAKRKALLKTLPQVTLEGVLLSYKQEAEYLGHMFQGNGDCDFDVSRRTAIARTTFNRLGWLWRSKKVEDDTKLSLFESLVLSQVQWGSEGWLLTEAVQAKLNGWCSRCVAIMFDVPPQKEASPRTQRMCLPGIIQYRRMVWLGHLMREDAGSLTRRAVLRFAELMLRGVVSVEGSILMDAPAHNSVAQLVWVAGGSCTAEEREDNRAQWKRWALQKLCAGDLARKKNCDAGSTSTGP